MTEETVHGRAPLPLGDDGSHGDPSRVVLDSRCPRVLDRRTDALRIVAGHVDLFAVRIANGRSTRARHHLFRVEAGEVVLGFPDLDATGEDEIRILAVGSLDAEAVALQRGGIEDGALVSRWIGRLAGVMAGPDPNWDIREGGTEADALAPGERRRGAARDILWLTVTGGTGRLMQAGPAYEVGGPAVPLTSGLWIAAGEDGCTVVGDRNPPRGRACAAALEPFHACALQCIRLRLAEEESRQAGRLARRTEQSDARTLGLFERLAHLIARRRAGAGTAPADVGDPLFAACRLVAQASHVSLQRTASSASDPGDIASVRDIARASRLRVRQILLRRDWWRWDGGPLLAWFDEGRAPVALLPEPRRGYVMVDPATGRRQRVTAASAMRIAPLAATFYPPLPSRPLKLRDLLVFAVRHARGSYGRLLLAIVMLGMLSWATPLVTQTIVTSVIPRTELDQLAYCALALVVTAIATAGVQLLEMTAMLRIEGLIDWKLQAAIIDRMLQLSASVFRAFTVGDFVDRSLGIDAIRRIFTGRTLRSLMAGVFCWFSIALMVYYDSRLALVAIGLIVFRAGVILSASALRLRHESLYSALSGKVSGLVLQLLGGAGKLRVADATLRGLAVWSEQYAAQKRQFVAARRIANGLSVFDGSFGVLATLVIFASALVLKSSLTRDLGAFLAFFAAFGQAMGSVGSWATGVSDSLAAIPHLMRMKPLIAGEVEISEARKPPGPLSGAVEMSRVTFRYGENGPPILDTLTLRIEPGEYVALVGPSGSGKSSLFRLLLGFERAEAGAIFYDGKAIDTLDVGALRRQFGVVLQNGKLTNGSIYDNICGGAQLPLEQVWEAARLASLDADIKAMPMGMHTVISEGVSTISGGQRQRIMIARAISRRPRILLLDEATSSLDNRSQAVVSAALGNLNVTRIVIAHRLSTVREADRILVLVDGKIVQSGSFDALNSQPGAFADLAQRQLA